MSSAQFTKADVEYLLKKSKYIKALPEKKREGSFWLLEAEVFFTDRPNVRIDGGVFVTARVIKEPLAGLPRAIPSTSLEWHGRRIRGLDRYLRHENPDGTRVNGWHEHQWSEKERDTYAVAIPEPQHKDLRGLFEYSLKRWKISIQAKQAKVR